MASELGERGQVDETLRRLGVEEAFFVDCHSHVVPCGDDGVQSIEEGASLCREAARRGTRVLFATPHVSPTYPMPPSRYELVKEQFELLKPMAGLELRLGFEITPERALLDEDPRRYVLEGTDLVLLDSPLSDSTELLVAMGQHVESAGLRPVIAHPEECIAIANDRTLAAQLAERGWLLALSGRGLLGRSGQIVEAISWTLLQGRYATVIASDGHRATNPPFLDVVFAIVKERLPELARGLFDGSALNVARAAAGPP